MDKCGIVFEKKKQQLFFVILDIPFKPSHTSGQSAADPPAIPLGVADTRCAQDPQLDTMSRLGHRIVCT